MACDFSVIMNPGGSEQIEAAGAALDVVHSIEQWLSIYRADSDLATVNRFGAQSPMTVRGDLFELILLAETLHHRTDGAFDMSAGALTKLWRTCRLESRIPQQCEVDNALQMSGMSNVELDRSNNRIHLRQPGLILDPGAIGKGLAIDEACTRVQESEVGPKSFLIHGGHSSLKAFGGHNGHNGWPVGIGNPLFTEKRLGTLLLQDRAMSTSGSNIQFFRYEGKRYGHILDPRTGWPVEGMLSVTVLAPSASVADAVSTAFFVMGVEKAVASCENWPEIGAILVPFPDHGRKVHPVVVGISPDMIVWDDSQVELN
jgi:thiamine biosynthesis lipoprotein